jgi:hypothetical protein
VTDLYFLLSGDVKTQIILKIFNSYDPPSHSWIPLCISSLASLKTTRPFLTCLPTPSHPSKPKLYIKRNSYQNPTAFSEHHPRRLAYPLHFRAIYDEQGCLPNDDIFRPPIPSVTGTLPKLCHPQSRNHTTLQPPSRHCASDFGELVIHRAFTDALA